jgi:cell wall assembly regulator SMI1
MDVRQSLYVHDGQDRGGKPTGILFGVTLLDCEEIVEEWQLWKTVAQAYIHETSPLPVSNNNNTKRTSRLFGTTSRFQNSRPPDTIQKVYAHPSWIPLAKDFSGNNIAVDLSPGPLGTWGQIILFGRDCDTKYVVARSWASFLAAVADDFDAGEARFEEDPFRGTSELRIRPCQGARDDTFLEVLKARVRLREREIRRKRESANQGKQGEKKIDLMVNSPILTGDGIPSPNLPRKSDSIAGSPVIPTPSRKESVTVSGPEILAKEMQENKVKGNRIVSGGVVLDRVITSPGLSDKSIAEELEKASTGLGIEGGKVNGQVTDEN